MIRRSFFLTTAALVTAFIVAGAAPEPIIGTWQIQHQELDGQKKETEPVMLKVSTDGDKYVFAFMVPMNNLYATTMTYTAKMDGSESEVKNYKGAKVGTVKLTSAGHAKYKLVLKSENHPESNAILTVSPDGKTLTSESDASPAGHVQHLVQTFSRK